MDIALKKIKLYPSMSDETNCYEASVYIDGVESVRVSNRGTGGCDEQYDIVPGSTDRLNNHFKRTLPATRLTRADGTVVGMFGDLESFCSEQLEFYEQKKFLTRKMKSSILFFREPNSPDLRGIKVATMNDQVVARYKEKNPSITLLNAMPIDEAVALLIKNTCVAYHTDDQGFMPEFDENGECTNLVASEESVATPAP